MYFWLCANIFIHVISCHSHKLCINFWPCQSQFWAELFKLIASILSWMKWGSDRTPWRTVVTMWGHLWEVPSQLSGSNRHSQSIGLFPSFPSHCHLSNEDVVVLIRNVLPCLLAIRMTGPRYLSGWIQNLCFETWLAFFFFFLHA